MAKLNSGGSGIDIDDGVYEALLMHVEIMDPTEKSISDKPWMKWTFTLFQGSEEEIELTAASSTAITPKAKARPWVEAVLGRKLANHEEIDTDDLSMKHCQIVLERNTETDFVRVTKVLAPKQERKRTAQGVAV